MNTRRLLIEIPEPDAADELYRLSGGDDRDAVTRTLVWDGPDDISETQEWIENCRTKDYEDWGYHWVLKDRTGSVSGTRNQPLGAIGLMTTDRDFCTNIGYWLGRPYWRQGIMTEAVRVVSDLAFDSLGFEKIEAQVFLGNDASASILAKAGFICEGTVRASVRKRGRLVDADLWGRLRTDAVHVADEPL
jgi:ribosomal-protein-alanine N-acetyltransferase